MARIRTTRDGTLTRVIVSGRLTAADMGRVEHACAPALIANPSPLELDLREVTGLDETASAVVRRLVTRGARVHGADDLLNR